MGKMKAVVLEKSGSNYIVLGENGTFRKVQRRINAEVGEEVEIQTGIEGFKGLRLWAGAAALFLLVLTSLFGWNLYQAPTAVALLSVDINPSLQFTLDDQGHLLKLQALDEDAKHMVEKIDLIGKPVDEVLENIVNLAFEQNFLNAEQRWVVVGYSPISDKASEQMPKELNEDHIIARVSETVEKKGLTPQIAVFDLTPEEQQQARKGDLTLGEYALWQTAQKAGVETQPKKLKESSERARILENPQVQAKVKEEKEKKAKKDNKNKVNEEKEKKFDSILRRTPGTSKRDLRIKDKPDNEDKEESIPKALPSRGKVPNIMIQKSRGEVHSSYNNSYDNKKSDQRNNGKRNEKRVRNEQNRR